MNTTGIFSNSSSVMTKYTQTGGNFKTYAARKVSGTATNSEGKTERHEWNYVQLYGKWYGIDPTWDDPVIKGTGYVSDSIKHRYFLVGSNEMNKNHFPNGQMTESGKKFVYPTIETEKYGK